MDVGREEKRLRLSLPNTRLATTTMTGEGANWILVASTYNASLTPPPIGLPTHVVDLQEAPDRL